MTVNALNIQALEPPLCVICIWYGEMIDVFALSGSTLFSVTNNNSREEAGNQGEISKIVCKRFKGF